MKNRALDEALRRRAAADRFTVSPGLEAAMLRAAGQAALAPKCETAAGKVDRGPASLRRCCWWRCPVRAGGRTPYNIWGSYALANRPYVDIIYK